MTVAQSSLSEGLGAIRVSCSISRYRGIRAPGIFTTQDSREGPGD